jgi:formamidopyrimidine-DNA glycosylase
MRRGIAAIVGSRICGVARPKCRLKPILISPELGRLRRRVVGRTITALDRIGKRVVIRLDDPRGAAGDSIVIEPRMTGLVLLADPPEEEHLRLTFHLSGGTESQLMFWDRRGLGTVRLVPASDFERRYGLHAIGPDALDVTADVLRQRLGASRREIKVALLDQKAVAGIGNLYASEILHQAGIHPKRRCHRLRNADWSALESSIRAVLEKAIRYEGSTLSDGTYRNALNEAGGFQNHHRVYDRAGRTCAACGSAQVVRIVQAQRSTFYCPSCQPARPPAAKRLRSSAALNLPAARHASSEA